MRGLVQAFAVAAFLAAALLNNRGYRRCDLAALAVAVALALSLAADGHPFTLLAMIVFLAPPGWTHARNRGDRVRAALWAGAGLAALAALIVTGAT